MPPRAAKWSSTGSTVQHLDPALLHHGRPGDRLISGSTGCRRLVVPEHLHQVAPPDTTFPPPRSLGGRTMPPAHRPSPWLVVAAELATLVEETTRSGRGVTTLVGPGGTGKTRLAVEVAEQIGVSFPGGVDVPRVTGRKPTTLDEAGLRSAPPWTSPPTHRDEQGIAAHLGERRTFLVLDNLEQLPEAALAVDRLLAAAETRILATSLCARPAWPANALHVLEPLAGLRSERGRLRPLRVVPPSWPGRVSGSTPTTATQWP